jgi:hypothetical protein
LVACDGDGGRDGGAGTTTRAEPTQDDLASLYRTVIREVCESATCDGRVLVSEDFSGDPDVTTEKLPDLVRAAALAELPGVTFIDPEEWNGSGLLILLGPAKTPLPDTVAIPAGYLCELNYCGSGTEYLFQRDGTAWEQVSALDLGLDPVIWES